MLNEAYMGTYPIWPAPRPRNGRPSNGNGALLCHSMDDVARVPLWHKRATVRWRGGSRGAV